MNTDNTVISRVWDVVRKVGVCMLTTNSVDGPRARPMEARPDPENDTIWFLTDRRGLKDEEVKAWPDVCLSFVCPEEKIYLCLTGEASVGHDMDRARDLWNEKQAVWWDGPDDPNLLVMQVVLDRAEIWDGPASSAVAAYEFAKARITGEKPHLGESRKLTVDFD